MRPFSCELRSALDGSRVRLGRVYTFPCWGLLRIELVTDDDWIEATITDTAAGRAGAVRWAARVAAEPDRARRYTFSGAALAVLRERGEAAGWERLLVRWRQAA